ncbi:hypothetical protein EN829_007010 [Mesorhizobium sp. M00.F.Ca.ET.186.01.1.1]|nr:hypothetical protein EN848_01655 [bacterium M00.F.Ca.ET.205.01.1.1]TGU54559.1 hypothetical protein EN795_06070 [bacterium M00.F.Ca.ET.152.01.1.1]TGV38660.1 hypothetical protein EN829_007010 [Mesorhizobium sp. M00.F.Ca.ET.186.01.1.1]TGZ44131.1 hypothetical protein EN805_06075 [bacterium M00.F.Ca.ET.162.01.1.1]
MTPTFTVDADNDHATALRRGGGLADNAPGAVLAGSRPVGRGPLLGGILRRLASLPFTPLRKGRRRLPPQDDYLRRDIGLPELEELPQYWDFTRNY